MSAAVSMLQGALDAATMEPPVEWPERFVQAVVAVLSAEAPGAFRVDAMPDKVAEYDIASYDGAILVHYRGSKYVGGNGRSPAVLQRRFDFDVHVIARGLAGKAGAPNVVEAVRRILQNRQIEGSLPLAPVEDGLHAEEKGAWIYVITFRGEIPAIGGRHPHPSEIAR